MKIENIIDSEKIEYINELLKKYNLLRDYFNKSNSDKFKHTMIVSGRGNNYYIENKEEKVKRFLIEYYDEKIKELEKEILELWKLRN